MALVLINPQGNPLGEFDADDTIVTKVKGGEVLTFATATIASDKAAADEQDGYQYTATNKAVLTTALTSGARPLMLCDDGTTNYGTLFGTVVGGTVGQQVTGGAVLGPHTATGSGKLTAWDKAGLYGVTLDAVDTAFTTGLVPTNPTLTAGASLFATGATTAAGVGLLTPNKLESFESAAGPTYLVVGNFIEFRTNGSLVTTPNRLVQALNSPGGATGTLSANLYMAVFHWEPSASRYV